MTTQIDYQYTGEVIEYKLTAGKYLFEVWGAQGGGTNGGQGGYAKGYYIVNKNNIDDKIFITVGGQNGYNGGGAAGAGGGGGSSTNGGGASDIRLNGTELSDRIIVAGGGGGYSNAGRGGFGGGKSGGPTGLGATQKNGYSLGEGQRGYNYYYDTSGTVSQGAYWSTGGGGGGYYGGFAAGQSRNSGFDNGSGGGSGYVSSLLIDSELASGGHFGDGQIIVTKLYHIPYHIEFNDNNITFEKLIDFDSCIAEIYVNDVIIDSITLDDVQHNYILSDINTIVGLNNIEIKLNLTIGSETEQSVYEYSYVRYGGYIEENAPLNTVIEYFDVLLNQIKNMNNILSNTLYPSSTDVRRLSDLINDINLKKNIMIEHLNNKGIDCGANDGLLDLIEYISNINQPEGYNKMPKWFIKEKNESMYSDSWMQINFPDKFNYRSPGGLSGTISDGVIHLLGSSSQRLHISFNADTKEIKDELVTPHDVSYGAACAMNGYIYYVGSGHVNFCRFNCNDENATWETRANRLGGTNATFPTLNVVNNNIYCIGQSYNCCYDETTNTWTGKTMTGVNIGYHGSAPYHDKIHVIGGASNKLGNLCYDTLTDTWTSKTNATIERVYCNAVNVKDELYTFGSGVGVEKYNPELDVWTTLTSAPASIDGNCTTMSHGDVIYNFCSPDNYVIQLYIYII